MVAIRRQPTTTAEQEGNAGGITWKRKAAAGGPAGVRGRKRASLREEGRDLGPAAVQSVSPRPLGKYVWRGGAQPS